MGRKIRVIKRVQSGQIREMRRKNNARPRRYLAYARLITQSSDRSGVVLTNLMHDRSPDGHVYSVRFNFREEGFEPNEQVLARPVDPRDGQTQQLRLDSLDMGYDGEILKAMLLLIRSHWAEIFPELMEKMDTWGRSLDIPADTAFNDKVRSNWLSLLLETHDFDSDVTEIIKPPTELDPIGGLYSMMNRYVSVEGEVIRTHRLEEGTGSRGPYKRRLITIEGSEGQQTSAILWNEDIDRIKVGDRIRVQGRFNHDVSIHRLQMLS